MALTNEELRMIRDKAANGKYSPTECIDMIEFLCGHLMKKKPVHIPTLDSRYRAWRPFKGDHNG